VDSAATNIQYNVLLDYDEESGWYAVTVPDLPGCYSQGRSVEEAEDNVREAIELHLEGLREDGLPIPPPSRDVLTAVDVHVA